MSTAMEKGLSICSGREAAERAVERRRDVGEIFPRENLQLAAAGQSQFRRKVDGTCTRSRRAADHVSVRVGRLIGGLRTSSSCTSRHLPSFICTRGESCPRSYV